MVMIFAQSWFSKKVKYLNTFAVVSLMMGVSWVMNMKGLSMIFWAFPTMGVTYFLLKSRAGLIVNILFIVGITLIFFDTLTKNNVLSIYPSLILVCFFGFVLSLCTEIQNKNLLRLVSEDTLTGVKNRRSFNEKIDEILANYKQSPKPVSMLVLDLDYFKKINDSHGHKQGDQVLIDFAQTVKSIIRSTDYIYRFGGEEFVVIAHSSLENSGVLGDSIREFIKISPSLSKYNVTVSIGVSEIEAADDADSFFRRADNALYEAKSSGRNAVRLARLDENNKVYCEALSHYRGIKSMSSKMHYLLRPQDDKKPNHLASQKPQTLNVVNIIDKV